LPQDPSRQGVMTFNYWLARFLYQKINTQRARRVFLILGLILCIVFSSGGVLSEEATAFVYDNKGKRDPFIPLVKGTAKGYTGLGNVESVDELVLEGILWDKSGGSIAVLNGVLLKKGDKVNNIQLLEITPKRAFLLVDGEKYNLTLEESGKGGER